MNIDSGDITFRPHRLGFFLALAVMLGAGLACLTLAAQQHVAWLGGAAITAALGGAVVSRYTAGSLTLRGAELVLYQGTFVTREVAYPLWRVRLEIRQSLFGRLLDAGTVVVQVGEDSFRCRLAQLRALRRLITERRLQLLALAEHHTLVFPLPRSRVLAGEVEERWH